jgi:hypothetical protein
MDCPTLAAIADEHLSTPLDFDAEPEEEATHCGCGLAYVESTDLCPVCDAAMLKPRRVAA